MSEKTKSKDFGNQSIDFWKQNMTPILTIDAVKDGLKVEAEELVLKKFPKKVIEVEELLKDERFKLKPFLTDTVLNIPALDSQHNNDIQSTGEQSAPKRPKLSDQSCAEDETNDCAERNKDKGKPVLYPSGVVPNNKFLEELVSVVKPQMLELMNDVLVLKIGISLLIPKIEDGNNFGVEVQREALEMANTVEEDIEARLIGIGTYYGVRAEHIAKVVKYPLNQDYRCAVRERDGLFHSFLCISLTLVRNYYTNLHDLVIKNMKKIKKPKSESNEEMLY